jgi:hypothetical protein
MGDIHVHEKLKACCRKTLAELDEKKKAAKTATGLMAVGSLVTMLGGSPVDVALGMIPGLVGKGAAGKGAGAAGDPAGRGADIVNVLRATCAKICERHALEHTGTEAKFWQQMVAGLDGTRMQRTEGTNASSR